MADVSRATEVTATTMKAAQPKELFARSLCRLFWGLLFNRPSERPSDPVPATTSAASQPPPPKLRCSSSSRRGALEERR